MKYRKLLTGTAIVAGIYAVMHSIAKKYTEDEAINDENPYLHSPADLTGFHIEGKSPLEGIKHTAEILKSKDNIYVNMVKPVLDRLLSFVGLVVLSPLYGAIALAIKLDDPGPVFFTQKRVGKNKMYFMCHKFRTMCVDTPHDVPTHQLSDPDNYITRVGRMLRRTSLDELPQIWDIFRGRMSIIGPRPALWNQDDLVCERDKYGANDIMPGLTGLAQISGRDELEIPDKAALDGEYTNNQSFLMDVKCFFRTIASVIKHDGVVEGGTGNLVSHSSRLINPVDPADVGFEEYGYKKNFFIDKNAYKKVLITGAGSYIGESFKFYCERNYPNISITIIDMRNENWRSFDFSGYDTVFHVAGIAHADVGCASVADQEKYYAVNTDLAIETARVAKNAGVRQFIFMSSMIIYGEAERIDEYTVPKPINFYGNSKWLADKGVRGLAEQGVYEVAVLRPPMIYGRGTKGNYSTLSKIAKRIPVFPDYKNRRSILYIENLCEFVGQLTLSGAGGIYFPQNSEYTSTSSLVREIGITVNHPTYAIKLLNPFVSIARHIPGKVCNLADKAFGSSYYEQKISAYEGIDYQRFDIRNSIIRTEERQTI